MRLHVKFPDSGKMNEASATFEQDCLLLLPRWQVALWQEATKSWFDRDTSDPEAQDQQH